MMILLITLLIAGKDRAWAAEPSFDANGDHTSDLIWRRRETGTVGLWLMNGTAILGQGTYTD
jgi:hypothetical protein